ncbi:MAG: ATP-grasp domain-containing protein [Burkholderiaceae bacterium]|nr:ATP-grasp domain-containing protein [Burkholderiaceae bacterium]
MTMLVVAAISARTMAEATARDGYEVAALDLFGDTDTRAASATWSALGEPGSLCMDANRLISALASLAQRGDVLGWCPGAGFEGRPDLLERGAAVLPLIGNGAAAVRRVRDPRIFFDDLDRLGIPHPEVRATPPADGDVSGWLVKDFQGTGGWHIRRWTRGDAVPTAGSPARYFQREAAGIPMSATFIANGVDACVLGSNMLKTRRFGAKPHVYSGAVGPVGLPAAVMQQIGRIVPALAGEFALRGLGSLDFLLDGDTVSVLEINPRPPASMALYEHLRFDGAALPERPTHGLMEAHIRACLRGDLPAIRSGDAEAAAVRGIEIVYARRPVQVDAAMTNRLSRWPGAHDLPVPDTHCTAGDPLCSVTAAGASADEVRTRLNDSRKRLLQTLETST